MVVAVMRVMVEGSGVAVFVVFTLAHFSEKVKRGNAFRRCKAFNFLFSVFFYSLRLRASSSISL